MDPQSQQVLDAAMALSDTQRAALVECLLDTLSPDPDAASDEQLCEELDRRRAELERGEAGLIPWSELKKQA